jgi:hypothetical protein
MATADWLFRALKTQLSSREQEQLTVAIKLLGKLADFGLDTKKGE